MTIQTLTQFFLQYGAFFIFVIVLPGFPAGIIMPMAGIWAARGEISFPLVLLISVGAGLAGSWVLYFLGRLGGQKLLEFYFKKFPKQRPLIEDKIKMLREKGGAGVFVSKLLPMVRTLISIPAGVVRMDFRVYTVSSAMGVFLWNLVFIGAGYFFGEAAINVLS